MNHDKFEIKIFTNSYVDKLCRDVKITSNVDDYYKDAFPFEERYPLGRTNIFIDQNLKLNPIASAEADLESCISLYEGLKLNETQAADPRLWIYLSHVVFYPYMRKRWALENVRKGDDPVGRVM